AINWNRIPDPKDQEVWDRPTGNLWLPEKIPLSHDIQPWGRRTEAEQTMALRVFPRLTQLEAEHGTVGAVSLNADSAPPHEEAVDTNIALMDSVHAKSYSQIFSTLASTKQIDEAFQWGATNEQLQKKAQIIMSYYEGDDPEKRKVASVLLESF